MLNAASTLGNLLASTPEFVRPPIDWHAVAPELCLLGGGAIITLVDVIWREKGRAMTSALAGLFLLAPLIPILTLAIDSEDRSMFNGAFIVDKYSLIVKAIFLLSGYLVVLLSTNYIAEGEYWEKRILWNASILNSGNGHYGLSPRPNHDIRSSRITFDTRLHVSDMAEKRSQK